MMRARVEVVLAAIFAIAAITTLVWPTWLENLTGLEPDGGTGAAESWLVLALGAAATVTASLSIRDFRAMQLHRSPGRN